MITTRMELLKDVTKVFKSKADDSIIFLNGVIYCVNDELSCIKRFIPNNYPIEIMNSLNNTVHISECINPTDKIDREIYTDKFINIVYKEFNPYMYDYNVTTLRNKLTSVLFTLIHDIDENSPIIESEDLVNDTSYSFIFDELFSQGTGIGRIITAKCNPKFRFTIYKGLVPYLKSDRISLRFLLSTNPNNTFSFYTDFKVNKKNGILDVFTRNLFI